MLEEGNTGQSFYAATRKLSLVAPTPQWCVKDIFAGKGPERVCEEVLKYFGGIANEEVPQMPQVDRCSSQLPDFTIARTIDLLKAAKKLTPQLKVTRFLTW